MLNTFGATMRILAAFESDRMNGWLMNPDTNMKNTQETKSGTLVLTRCPHVQETDVFYCLTSLDKLPELTPGLLHSSAGDFLHFVDKQLQCVKFYNVQKLAFANVIKAISEYYFDHDCEDVNKPQLYDIFRSCLDLHDMTPLYVAGYLIRHRHEMRAFAPDPEAAWFQCVNNFLEVLEEEVARQQTANFFNMLMRSLN